MSNARPPGDASPATGIDRTKISGRAAHCSGRGQLTAHWHLSPPRLVWLVRPRRELFFQKILYLGSLKVAVSVS